MARILAISSQVVRGHIGLSAIAPALQALGHEVWPMPTIILSNHPGHAHAAGVPTPVDRLGTMLDALDSNGWLGELDAVLTGYLPSPDHVTFAAHAIAKVRRLRPSVAVIVDPILGDEPKGLYIDAAAAAAIRDKLVPQADILTPNRFELGWLTHKHISTLDDARAAASALERPSVIVTSAAYLPSPSLQGKAMIAIPGTDRDSDGTILTLLVSDGTTASFATLHRAHAPHGTGDLLSGLLLGHVLAGRSIVDATACAVAGVAHAIDVSSGHDELVLAGQFSAIAGARPVALGDRR